MKRSWIKMIIALMVAAGAGTGYYIYAQPPKEAVAYVATTNLVAGETLQPDMIRPIEIMGDQQKSSVQSKGIIGKTVKHSLQKGDWINPSLLANQQPRNIRYYTLHLSYVQADGGLLREGMKVDVWAQASDTSQAHKVLLNVPVFRLMAQGGKQAAVGNDLNIVLSLHDNQIAALEAAKKQAPLFLVVEGDELP